MLFVRDFDRVKYVIVTFLIFSISVVLDTGSKYNISGVFVLYMLFIAIVDIQLSLDMFVCDKKMKTLYAMAELNWKTYLNQKRKFLTAITFFGGILYSIVLFFRFNLDIYHLLFFEMLALLYSNCIAGICCNDISRLILQQSKRLEVQFLLKLARQIINMFLAILCCSVTYFMVNKYPGSLLCWGVFVGVEFLRLLMYNHRNRKLNFGSVVFRYHHKNIYGKENYG